MPAERLDIESFLDPFAAEPAGWLGELRRGLRSDPLGSAQRLNRIDAAQSAVAPGSSTSPRVASTRPDGATTGPCITIRSSWTLAAARLGGAGATSPATA